MSFFEIFQPGLEHLRREKDRYKMLVSKPTHGGGAPLGIDLDAGVATIKIPARQVPDAAPEEAEPQTAEAGTAETGTTEAGTTEPGSPEAVDDDDSVLGKV